MSTFAVIIMILVGVNFDLRITQSVVGFENWVAFIVAKGAYLTALFGLLFGCWTLFRSGVLTPVVRETAKVTSMVFTILIGSQLAEPGGDLLRRRALHPAIPAQLRQRDRGLPDGDAGAVRPGLRARFPRDHLHRRAHRRAGDLWRHLGSEMGDDHDRGQPADIVPDPALWLRAVLFARGGAARGHDAAHLSRGHPFRADPGARLGDFVVLPVVVTIVPDLIPN